MNKEFYAGNRKSLYQKLEAGSLVVVFSGHAPIKTNDENYPFFTNRNFLYLTGIEQENIVLMTYVGEGTIEETLYLLPPDAFAERWTGRRIKEEEAEELSGITNYKYVAAFRNDLSRQLFSGNVKKVYLDFDKVYENTPAVEAYRLGKYLKEHAPFVGLGNLHPIMKQLRLISILSAGTNRSGTLIHTNKVRYPSLICFFISGQSMLYSYSLDSQAQFLRRSIKPFNILRN